MTALVLGIACFGLCATAFAVSEQEIYEQERRKKCAMRCNKRSLSHGRRVLELFLLRMSQKRYIVPSRGPSTVRLRSTRSVHFAQSDLENTGWCLVHFQRVGLVAPPSQLFEQATAESCVLFIT